MLANMPESSLSFVCAVPFRCGDETGGQLKLPATWGWDISEEKALFHFSLKLAQQSCPMLPDTVVDNKKTSCNTKR